MYIILLGKQTNTAMAITAVGVTDGQNIEPIHVLLSKCLLHAACKALLTTRIQSKLSAHNVRLLLLLGC